MGFLLFEGSLALGLAAGIWRFGCLMVVGFEFGGVLVVGFGF